MWNRFFKKPGDLIIEVASPLPQAIYPGSPLLVEKNAGRKYKDKNAKIKHKYKNTRTQTKNTGTQTVNTKTQTQVQKQKNTKNQTQIQDRKVGGGYFSFASGRGWLLVRGKESAFPENHDEELG